MPFSCCHSASVHLSLALKPALLGSVICKQMNVCFWKYIKQTKLREGILITFKLWATSYSPHYKPFWFCITQMLAIPIIWIKVMIFVVAGHISWLLLFHISAVPKGEERTLRCLTKAWFPGLAQVFCVNFGMLLCCLSFCFIFLISEMTLPCFMGSVRSLAQAGSYTCYTKGRALSRSQLC